MRTVLLTTVAAAALAALSFQASAQDNAPARNKAPPAAESNRAPAAQQKSTVPEHAGRSATAPTAPGESGAAKQEMKQKGGAKHEMKGGAAKQEMKSERGSAENATPSKPAKKQSAEQGSMQKPSAGKQPMTTQGKTGKQGAQHATGATEQKGRAAETKAPPSSTMRSVAPGSNEPRSKAMEKGPSATTDKGVEQTPGKTPSPGASTGRSATGQKTEQTPGKTVTLNSHQQTEIRSALLSEPVENIDRVDFSVTTGTIIPEYVPIRPLPDRIVEIVPQYRGYDFAMVRHDIVIIEPRTRRIVTVLHGEGRSAVNAPRGRLHITEEQRQLIRRDLTPEGSAIHTEVQLGERVPEDISLLTMPAAVVSDIPILSPYSYFMTDEDIVLVEPDTREIIEIIR
jgi:hypothetical protein